MWRLYPSRQPGREAPLQDPPLALEHFRATAAVEDVWYSRGFLHWPPLHIVVELLHDGQPLP